MTQTRPKNMTNFPDLPADTRLVAIAYRTGQPRLFAIHAFLATGSEPTEIVDLRPHPIFVEIYNGTTVDVYQDATVVDERAQGITPGLNFATVFPLDGYQTPYILHFTQGAYSVTMSAELAFRVLEMFIENLPPH